ncbi:MAG: hypothetical protein Q9M29_04160, partial [Mariprofundaceae bacterium]|nr:hypothetical protein [Mariprofundaceae bacterium]
PAGFGLAAEQGQALPDPVKLLAPPQLHPPVIHQQSAQLSWLAVDGARSYRLQLASDAAFSQLLYDTLVEQAQTRIDNLPAGHYYWRVRAIDNNSLGGKNASAELDIQPAPIQSLPDYDMIAPIHTLILSL